MKEKKQNRFQKKKFLSSKKLQVTIMKFKEKYDIAKGFETLFEFNSKETEIEHEAKMIMFRFLSELERLHENQPLAKKTIAEAIGTSPSYITQIFQGDKLLNLMTLAKLQEAYNFTFEIKAVPNKELNFLEQTLAPLKVMG